MITSVTRFGKKYLSFAIFGDFSIWKNDKPSLAIVDGIGQNFFCNIWRFTKNIAQYH